MTNSSIRPSTLVTFAVGTQTTGEPTLRVSGRVFPSVKIASSCSFTGSFTGYFTDPIRLCDCKPNGLDRPQDARWNVLQTGVRRERRRTSTHGASLTSRDRFRLTMECSVPLRDFNLSCFLRDTFCLSKR